jgi:hypothetical protein
VPAVIRTASPLGGLSEWACVGIAVGFIIGIGALVFVAWLLWRRRKKAQQLHGPESDLSKVTTNGKSGHQKSAQQLPGISGRYLPILQTVEESPESRLAEAMLEPKMPHSETIAPKMNSIEGAGAVAGTTASHHEAENREIREAPPLSSGNVAGNPDVDRMRQEMAEIQAHKSRLEQLYALSARERELKQAIQAIEQGASLEIASETRGNT